MSEASQASTLDRRTFLKTPMLATRGSRVAAWVANAVWTANAAESQRALTDEGPLPDLGGAVAWLNSDPQATNHYGGKSCWAISGRIPASTLCDHCLM